MASTNALAAFALFALTLPMLSRATEHIVGDELGWTPGFNYTLWAQGKEFRVGDTLVFKYTVGENSVFKVSGPQFQQCAFPPVSEAMTTGNDVVVLATEGRKWYISGAGYGANCRAGQKLFITVLPAAPKLSQPTEHVVGDEFGWTPGFNYTVWAQGKEFRVGDTLVFKYTVGENSVFKVGAQQFQQCAFPPMSEAMTTGNDVVVLATEGRKWYISGAGYGANCRAGQKLVITVVPAAATYWGLKAMHSDALTSEPPVMPPSGWEHISPSAAADAAAPAPSPSDGPAPTASRWSTSRFLMY